jgi:hypothetical protein
VNITPEMMDALDKAGPDARAAFFARRTPDERQALAKAIPKWRDSKPGVLESAGRGAAQTASLGFADELAGGAEALLDKARGSGADLGDLYRQHRDESRANYRAAQEANPNAYTAGEAAGVVGTMLIPGLGELGAAKTLGGAVLGGAALGAAQGLGSSEADLTKGDVGGAALDTGLGALVGGAAGAVGHGVGKVVDRVSGRAAQGVRLAEADAAQEANATAQKGVRVARASLGGEAAAGLNAVDKAEQIAANASGHYTPAQTAEASAWLQTPEVAALRQRAGGNVLEAGQNRLPGSLQTAENVFQQAQQNATPQAVQAAAEASLQNPIRRQFTPRLATLGHRLLPAALAGLGGVIGGPEGAAVGAGVGGVVALTQGRPGIILRNLVRSPATRKMLWEFVGEAASSKLLGRFGAMLQRASQQSGVNGMLALHEALMSQSTEYQDEVGKTLLDSGGTQ